MSLLGPVPPEVEPVVAQVGVLVVELGQLQEGPHGPVPPQVVHHPPVPVLHQHITIAYMELVCIFLSYDLTNHIYNYKLQQTLSEQSKDTITFKGVDYVNDASIEEDPKSTWRHNLFAELVEPYNGGYYWPSTVILDTKLEKIRSFPGSQKTPQFKRLLMNFMK